MKLALGIHSNIPFEDYAAIEAVNQSTLKDILLSPAHYVHALCEQKEKTKSMTRGNASHYHILEPDLFDKYFAVFNFEGKTRNSAEFKAWKKLPENANREDLTFKEFAEVNRLRSRVMEFPLAADIINGAENKELTLVWEDQLHPDKEPVLCKCRIDLTKLIEYGKTDIHDLKTSVTSDRDGFARQCRNYRYEFQAAFYCRGWEILTGQKMSAEQFKFIVVEAKTGIPAIYWLDEEVFSIGQRMVKEALNAFMTCRDNQRWPGPNQGKPEFLKYYPNETKEAELTGFSSQVTPL